MAEIKIKICGKENNCRDHLMIEVMMYDVFPSASLT